MNTPRPGCDGEDDYEIRVPAYDFAAFCGICEVKCLDGEV
jgi:hypothetical protein